LLDNERRAIEEGFKQDETGVFEKIERDAAEIGEWLKECRHPRDSERFRESLKFVRSDIVVWPVLGVEVRPGVYKLDLSIWEAEVARPFCNYLRRLADEMGNDPSAYAMSFDGAHWHISYDSEKGFVNDSKGAGYVAQLLERRGKSIPCYILYRSSEHSLTKNDPTISRDDAVEELAVLRVRLAELRQGMEEKPHEVLPEDRDEERQILDRISQLTGRGGRPRQKGAADASRTAVHKAVKRFYHACRQKKLDAFVNHLESNLDMGSNPVYSGSIDWKISRVTPDVTM
jgi:hypothetical protein